MAKFTDYNQNYLNSVYLKSFQFSYLSMDKTLKMKYSPKKFPTKYPTHHRTEKRLKIPPFIKLFLSASQKGQ